MFWWFLQAFFFWDGEVKGLEFWSFNKLIFERKIIHLRGLDTVSKIDTLLILWAHLWNSVSPPYSFKFILELKKSSSPLKSSSLSIKHRCHRAKSSLMLQPLEISSFSLSLSISCIMCIFMLIVRRQLSMVVEPTSTL